MRQRDEPKVHEDYTDRTEEERWVAMAEGRRGEVSQSWFSSEKRIGPRVGAKTERRRRNREVQERQEDLHNGGVRPAKYLSVHP